MTKNKEFDRKANIVVKMMKSFSEKELYPKMKSVKSQRLIECFEDIQSIFLVGVWYGAYKTLELEDKYKEHKEHKEHGKI